MTEKLMRLNRRDLIKIGGAGLLSAPFVGRTFGQSSKTLIAAFPREVLTVDGNFSTLRENDILGLLVNDSLFAVDPVSSTAVPLAAKSYEIQDGATLVVHVRNDVLFHDGSPLTADDVAYTYNFLINPKSNNEYLERFSRWLEGCEAKGQDTVVFHMKFPYSMVLFDLSMYSKLVKKGTYDDPSKPNGVNPEAQSLKLNGTGPYRVTFFRPAQEIRLERFAHYRSNGFKGSPTVDAITIRIIPDWSTQAAEVLSGGVHWTFGMPHDIALGANASGIPQLKNGPSLRTFYISLDAAGLVTPGGPLTKVDVRRAINHAIDRKGILKNLRGGDGEPLRSACIPSQFGCSQDVVEYSYDPEKAKALLGQAGYANGFSTELWAARDPDVVEAVAAQLGQVGIHVDVRQVKGPTLSEARSQNKIPMEWASSGSFGTPDVGALLPDRLGSDSHRNYSGDIELGKLIAAANSTFDQQKRKATFQQALQRIADQAYWVPMYTDDQDYLMSTSIEYQPFADGMDRLYTVKWV